MNLVPGQDELDLALSLRRLLADHCPTSLVRELRGSTEHPAKLWQALAEAGVFGLALPEAYGGAGGSLSDLGVFFREAGRGLCPLAVHGTVLAALAVDRLGGPEHRGRWLPALAEGATRATTALWSPRDASILAPVLTAERDAAGWRLHGVLDFVADADGLLVVSADAGGRTLAMVVEATAPDATPLEVMGGFRLSTVRFDGVVVPDDDVLGQPAADDLRWLAQTAVALLSLDMVGVAEAALQRTVEHTCQRQQFGRPIASFQAAQHLVADMHIAVSAARLAAQSAVHQLGQGEVATRETAIARVLSATAATRVTLDAHQLHGGMGYVLETDLHLWSERARVLATLGGTADVAAQWLEATWTA